MIRILLVDDHEIVRSGLRLFLNNLIEGVVIDEAPGGNEALQKVKDSDYRLIILDLNMPGTNSFDLLKNILNARPSASILIFSINPEDVHAKRYLQLGAKGYVNKNASPEQLRDAVNTILQNKLYISPSLAQIITEDILDQKEINPFNVLSPRELEIVLHLIRGEQLSAIRKSLNLKASTVSTYKARIFEKLKCKNVMELNQLAKAYNIISSG